MLIHFQSCGRHIDDLLTINNNNYMKQVMHLIYPKELILVPDGLNGKQCPFLDLQLQIKDKIISTSIFDKRDDFDFPIVNFPNLSGNIPTKSAHGVFMGEAVRYARACTYLHDFKFRLLSLVKKSKMQEFTQKGLRSAWFKFCDSHILLIQKYGSEVLDLHNVWM